MEIELYYIRHRYFRECFHIRTTLVLVFVLDFYVRAEYRHFSIIDIFILNIIKSCSQFSFREIFHRQLY